MEGEELPLNERIDSMSDQEVGDALRNELASAQAVLGSLDEATMTPYLEQQRAEARIPLEEKDIEKYEPPEFIKSGLLGIAGAAGMAGSVVLAGAYLGGAGDWSVLASGAMAAAGIVQSGMGLNAFVNYALDRGRKQGLEPTMERVAEEAAMQRRPKRFAEGGDIWQSHPTMKPEHGALQDISGEFSIYDSKVENQHGRYSLYQKNPDYGREYWTIYDPSEMQIERQQAISDELQAHNARLRERGPSNIGSDESEAIQAARRALFAEQHALRQDATKMIADRNKHTGMPLTFYHGATEKDLEKSVPHYDAKEEKQIDVQSPNTIRGSNSLDFIKQHAEKLIRQKEQGFDDNADYGDDDIPPRPDGPKEPPPDITPSSLQPSPSMSDAEATYASHMASGGDIGESSEIVNQTMFAPPDDIEDANFRIDSENDIPTLIPTAEDERDWRQQVMDSLDQEPQKDFEIPGSELDIDIPDEIMMAEGGNVNPLDPWGSKEQPLDWHNAEDEGIIESQAFAMELQLPHLISDPDDDTVLLSIPGEDQYSLFYNHDRSEPIATGHVDVMKQHAQNLHNLNTANRSSAEDYSDWDIALGEQHAEKGLPPEPGMPDEYYTGHRQYLERPQMAGGGTVPVLVEPGEKIESPSGNEEMKVPTLMGKPDSGDVVPMELPVGSHVKEKGQSQSDNVLQGGKGFDDEEMELPLISEPGDIDDVKGYAKGGTIQNKEDDVLRSNYRKANKRTQDEHPRSAEMGFWGQLNDRIEFASRYADEYKKTSSNSMGFWGQLNDRIEFASRYADEYKKTSSNSDEDMTEIVRELQETNKKLDKLIQVMEKHGDAEGGEQNSGMNKVLSKTFGSLSPKDTAKTTPKTGDAQNSGFAALARAALAAIT